MTQDQQRKDFGLSTGSLSGEDDTEGHGRRFPVTDEADDTEGHAIRSGRAVKSGRATDEGDATDEPDDTEGHGVRVRI